MCCKLTIIPELEKPFNTWCQHCSTRSGCDAYETRPQRCREYNCYFVMSDLPEEWRPNKSRIMITPMEGKILAVIDPSRPDAWRKEPYLTTLKNWANQVEVHVMVNEKTYAVFPDHIDDLGEVTEDHQILTFSEATANGPRRRSIRALKSEVPAILASMQQ